MFSLTDIYNIAVQIERNGEKDYREAAGNTADEKLKNLYLELARQETEHAAWFTKMAENPECREREFEDAQLQKLSKDVLQKMVKDSSFLREEHDFSAVESFEEAVDTAIESENDTIIFYQFLYDLVEEEEVRKGLEKIIAEEQNHIEILEKIK